MKLLIMQFSPTSCLFIPLWAKHSPQHPQLGRPSPPVNLSLGRYFLNSKMISNYIIPC
jgi:hypothetical protein